MKVKNRWTNDDFEQMGWHDCRVYSVALPEEDFSLKLDIDYIFRWDERPGGGYSFWVSPCDLVFLNVSDFSARLHYGNRMLLFISDLKRGNQRLSPNGKMMVWDYEIECDQGTITFSATGFEQIVRSQPKASETQDLGRKLRVVP